MPRGVYDRSKAKPRTRKTSSRKPNKTTTKTKVVKKDMVLRAKNKKPVEEVVAPKTHMDIMDVPLFMERLTALCAEMRSVAQLTTHTKEKEFLNNVAIVCERQFMPKYKEKLSGE